MSRLSYTPGRPSADEGWLTGQLLIAMPNMPDERFRQTVILLCAHSEDGAMGLVLNRPLAGLSFDSLLRQLGITPVPPARQIRMLQGGPVEAGRGFVLHSGDWQTEGTLRIGRDLGLTASVEVLKAIAAGEGPRDCVLALGYAGWGPGQLEHEIAANAWLTAPADAALLYQVPAEQAWAQALSRIKVDPLLLSGAAGRA
ncbi:MAG: YqgE/AlgH family protein [Rhodovarius sp.]|nr:YqgE/AlgH family protein [Rhodovarius sp.]MCX7933546.1 YqgE/AlgH family protein [Rhodovarius sp.]MDW8313698.1 YqgE/AlgH family protein [Rhodovarius sp.]